MAAPLRVVADGEKKPTRRRPQTIKQAVDGSERDVLLAVRRALARELDSGPPAHAIAPLVRQLREVDRDLRALDASAKEEEQGGDGDAGDAAFDATAV